MGDNDDCDVKMNREGSFHPLKVEADDNVQVPQSDESDNDVSDQSYPRAF